MCMKQLVTIILPTKDRLSLLKRAVDSILKQDYSNIELIIIDDSSSDGTKQFLTNLVATSCYVTVLTNESSKGACVSRNRAVEVASGQYITCMDDDDYLKPNHISNLLSHLSEDYSCVSANMARVVDGKEKPFAYYTGSVDLDNHFYYNRIGNHILTFTSRLKAVGGFDEDFPAFQDYECWTRIIKAYGPVYRVPECTYILDNHHGFERISSSSSRKIMGLDLFLSKYRLDMKPKHKRSLSLLRKRFLKEQVTLFDVVSSFSVANARFVISSYLSNFR